MHIGKLLWVRQPCSLDLPIDSLAVIIDRAKNYIAATKSGTMKAA